MGTLTIYNDDGSVHESYNSGVRTDRVNPRDRLSYILDDIPVDSDWNKGMCKQYEAEQQELKEAEELNYRG